MSASCSVCVGSSSASSLCFSCGVACLLARLLACLLACLLSVCLPFCLPVRRTYSDLYLRCRIHTCCPRIGEKKGPRPPVLSVRAYVRLASETNEVQTRPDQTTTYLTWPDRQTSSPGQGGPRDFSLLRVCYACMQRLVGPRREGCWIEES